MDITMPTIKCTMSISTIIKLLAAEKIVLVSLLVPRRIMTYLISAIIPSVTSQESIFVDFNHPNCVPIWMNFGDSSNV